MRGSNLTRVAVQPKLDPERMDGLVGLEHVECLSEMEPNRPISPDCEYGALTATL
jgi:hypothetical protein